MSTVTLEISFYGPFVYELLEEKLLITAPRCPGHLASVHSDTDEKALPGCASDKKTPYHYVLTPVRQIPNAPDPKCVNEASIILVESWRKKASPLPGDHHFQIDLPRPDHILGLIPDYITYTEHDLDTAPVSSNVKRATAMRFYYTRFDQSDVFNLIETAGDHPGKEVHLSHPELRPTPDERSDHISLCVEWHLRPNSR